MTEEIDELIRGKMLHKLARIGKRKASHTAIENLYGYLPRHMRDRAKVNVDELIHRGILIKKVTGYGVHVSINYVREKINEIERLISKFLRSGVKFMFI